MTVRTSGFVRLKKDDLATESQKSTAYRLLPLAQQEASFLVEIRHSAFIGTDIPPSLTLSVDGRIWATIYKDGTYRR